ncbi:MAG: hypothetical protein AABX29_07630 [Nanoarchaeota archaeon]
MKRGISLFLVILLLNQIVFAINLETNKNQNEKDLIESCRFPSSGPELVLQKTQFGEAVIWLYEPDKERFGDLTAIKPTNIEKIGKNKYSFKTEESNQIYSVEAVIPDYCIRPKETTAEKESIQTKEVCGSPQTTTSIFMEGRGYVCLYNIPDPLIQSEQAILSTGILPQTCPQEYCVDIEDSEPVSPTTQPISQTNQENNNVFTAEQQRDIAKGLEVILSKIINFFISLIKNIIELISNLFTQPNKITPPLNPPITTTTSTEYTTSTTTEEICNIEGIFNGKVRRNINIIADIKEWTDTNTDAKVDYELTMEVDKNNKKEFCGIPKKATYLIRTEGAAFHKGLWPISVSYVNIAETLRNSALNIIRKNSLKLYGLLKLGIIGQGGVIVDPQGTGTNPKFIGIEKQRTLWDFLRITKKEPNGWLKFEIETTFMLNTDNTVTATIKEKVIKDNQVIYETTPTKREGITIKEYKENYINDMIKTIDSIENLKEKFDQITNKGNKKILKRTVYKGADIKKWVEDENLKEIPNDPKINSVTIKIEETVDKEQLENYKKQN